MFRLRTTLQRPNPWVHVVTCGHDVGLVSSLDQPAGTFDVTWPTEDPSEPRETNWGLGIGFEMFVADNRIQVLPATF